LHVHSSDAYHVTEGSRKGILGIHVCIYLLLSYWTMLSVRKITLNWRIRWLDEYKRMWKEALIS